jgi:hypothetical protein
MDNEPNYSAFAGARRVAAGPLREVLPILKERFERDRGELLLLFEVATGKQVEIDLRAELASLLEQHAPSAQKGPGRPKLGVVSREVSLLPRHWRWLEEQPNGISAALRRLVEQGIKHEPGKQRAQRLRVALHHFMTALAGDRPHYEEALRALYAGQPETLAELIERWPKDIREHVLQQVRAIGEAEAEDV